MLSGIFKLQVLSKCRCVKDALVLGLCTKGLLCTEGASPASEDEGVEGTLVRKHEWESAAKRASNR